MKPAHFSPDTLRFIRDLKKNNERAWFVANKDRYEETVKDPALRFIADFAPKLAKLSPHFMATPRSLFRIHRDTRFSKDKSPYKTHVGIHFRHDGAKDAHAPGYYLHIEPKSVFAGVGIWHPEAGALRLIRERIVEEPAAWKRATTAKTFTGTFELAGDRLKRPPKGFDLDHPFVEDLKRKDFIGVVELDDAFVTKGDLPERLAKTFAAGTPLMRLLCDALDVPF
ncbi:MAG TPA: DUF2461 domain-containing protein [Longimicrobiales bacterium]|nr:DUF2461 domain-containing protein [Longimicrobiales bacterium]